MGLDACDTPMGETNTIAAYSIVAENKAFWAPCKSRLLYSCIEGVTVAFDTLSTQSHFLTDYHLALLEQIPTARNDALGFADLLLRVAEENDVEDGADLGSVLTQALEQMVGKALVECKHRDL